MTLVVAVLVVGETWSKPHVHSASVLCHWGGGRERRSKKPWKLQEVKKMKKILLVIAL